MTFKEWNAAIMLAGQALVTAWLVNDAMAARALERSVSEVSRTLMWATAAMVVFNIVATIIVTILVSVVRREALKDESADERDRAVAARSMRNAYVVLSIGAACSLLLLALGFEPVVTAYALFTALTLAGATDSASRLYAYRFG
jgi:ABC-type polysaccharide/polyol phosphate export permease